MRAPEMSDDPLTGRSARMFGLFQWYARRYMARHFHAVRVSRTGPLPDSPDRPIVMVSNHPSWWDPLTALVLARGMARWRVHYAPMEDVGLSQYRILEKVGFFGIDTTTPRGARRFLQTCLELLKRPESTLWITAQGRFLDVRERPARLMSGIGHLAHRAKDTLFVPTAIEYPFWDDRCPEALLRFGPPIEVTSGRDRSATEWVAAIESALVQTQDQLAAEAMTRDPERFTTILAGTSGVGGVYDVIRRFRAWRAGTTFRPEHVSRSGPGASPAFVPERGPIEGARNSSR